MESSQWTKSIFPVFLFSFQWLLYTAFYLSFVDVREFSNADFKISLRRRQRERQKRNRLRLAKQQLSLFKLEYFSQEFNSRGVRLR